MPAHYIHSVLALKGAQVVLGAVSEQQIGDVGDPGPVGLGDVGWSSSRLGAQRRPWVESVMHGVKALGCSVCKPPP